jgi:hypothetical protein
MSLRMLFLAPGTRTVPSSRFPPTTSNVTATGYVGVPAPVRRFGQVGRRPYTTQHGER